MKTLCVRLRRGMDLLDSIKNICVENHIKAGVILSSVGCISKGRVRDTTGANIQDIPCHCEILSVNGTVSEKRCHLHIALSKEDLSVIGGHLISGCIINTTAELVIGILDQWEFYKEFDDGTGYDEIIFRKHGPVMRL